MCGISVLLGKPGVNVAPFIHAMTDMVRHRGPDDEGYLFSEDKFDSTPTNWGGDDTPEKLFRDSASGGLSGHIGQRTHLIAEVAMGHRRLKITDVSDTSHQPFVNSAGTLAINFNGQIYNFRELRTELEGLGRTFRTNGDTEVVLKAYEQWGQDCLSHFRGMFAFVIIDFTRWQFFAARDRFGIKPIYYWTSPNGFLVFGSEIKQFSCLPGWKARADKSSVVRFLSIGESDGFSSTMFQDVFQIQPGHSASGSIDTAANFIKQDHWYDMDLLDLSEMTDTELELHAEHLIVTSVDLHSQQEVSQGMGISGGLDSSLLYSLMTHPGLNGEKKRIDSTVSVLSNDPRIAEEKYVDILLSSSKAKKMKLFPTSEDFLECLTRLHFVHDEPIGGLSVAAEYLAFQTAGNSGLKVTIEGHGADEIFCGYHDFLHADISNQLARGRLISGWLGVRKLKSLHGVSTRYALSRAAENLLPYTVSQSARRFLNRSSSHPDWINKEIPRQRPEKRSRVNYRNKSNINKLSKLAVQRSSLPAQLRWTDRNSMANSVESRVPYLDHKIVEFALSLGARSKIRDGNTKVILRSVAKKWIPPELSLRTDKVGYAVSDELMMFGENKEKVRKIALESVEIAQEFFNDKAGNDINQTFDGNNPYRKHIWRSISLGQWMKVFSVS